MNLLSIVGRRLRAAVFVYGAMLFSGCLVIDVITAREARSAQPRNMSAVAQARSASFQQSGSRQQGTRWEIQWNPTSGAATSGLGSPPERGPRTSSAEALRQAEAFVRRHGAALGTELESLQRVRLRYSGRAWHVTWQQHHAGQPVVDAFLNLTLREDAAVVAFRSSLHPELQVEQGTAPIQRSLQASKAVLGADLHLESAQEILVVSPVGAPTAEPAHELTLRNASGGRWRLRLSRVDGTVLHQRNLVRTQGLGGSAVISGHVSAEVNLNYRQDDPVLRTLPWLGLELDELESEPVAYTERDGSFEISTTVGTHLLRARLHGKFAQVSNNASESSALLEMIVDSPGQIELQFDASSARLDERTLYYHVNFIHDYFKDRFGFDLLDFPVPVVAASEDPGTGDPNFPNAFWNGERLAFGNGGRTFFNMGLFSDVIYHEYTHATTDYIYRPVGGLEGLIGDSMHEGISDYFAATLNGEPLIGENISRDRSPYIRRLDNGLVMPDNFDSSFRPNLHRNGLILAAALWDLRQDVGATITDALAHHARELLPRDYVAFMQAVQLQDDLLFDDGIPGNGSPHHDAIVTAFGRHGIGPLGEGALVIVHRPLGDTEDAQVPRQVHASLQTFHPGSSRATRLFWSTGGEFEGIWMQEDTSGNLVASIPGQPQGARVRYYLAAALLPPVQTATLPKMAPDEYFEYVVRPDELPPTISHTPPTQHASFTGAPRIVARLRDNMGIANAWLEYRIDEGDISRAGFAADPTEPEQFRAQIPRTLAIGQRLRYRIHATDLSQAAHTTISPSLGWHEMDIVEVLSLDFETDPTGWSHKALLLDRADTWQLSSANNHSPGGIRAWQVQTAITAPQRIAAALTTAEFSLEEAATASIWSRIRAAVGQDGAVDGGQVQIQHDGLNWELLVPSTGYTHSIGAAVDSNYLLAGSPCLSGSDPEWRQLQFDLTPYRGKSIRLRFLFGSATSTSIDTSEWYLDDFQLHPGTVIPSDTKLPLVSVRAPLLQQGPSPNPFNPAVEFQLRAEEFLPAVQLDILNGRGHRVRRLLQGPLPPGTHRLIWDGRDARGLASASGVYYYLLESGLGRETGKLVLVR